MSTTDVSSETSTEATQPATIDMKLEDVNVLVSDVDRAKGSYESLGWRLDGDFAVGEDFRAVQYTPLHDASDATGRYMEEVLHVLPR
jgi:hypothetical protein